MSIANSFHYEKNYFKNTKTTKFIKVMHSAIWNLFYGNVTCLKILAKRYSGKRGRGKMHSVVEIALKAKIA